MGDPLTIGLAGGAAMGLLTNAEKRKQHKKDMKVQATREETSPWTGVHGQYESAPGVMGDMAGGLSTGASMGLNYQSMQNQQALQQQMLKNQTDLTKSQIGVNNAQAAAPAVIPAQGATLMGPNQNLQQMQLMQEIERLKAEKANAAYNAAAMNYSR